MPPQIGKLEDLPSAPYKIRYELSVVDTLETVAPIISTIIQPSFDRGSKDLNYEHFANTKVCPLHFTCIFLTNVISAKTNGVALLHRRKQAWQSCNYATFYTTHSNNVT